jgi:hypothetical protein
MKDLPHPQNPLSFTGIPNVTVLAIVGSEGRPVKLALHQLRADMSSCGITVNIFESGLRWHRRVLP